MSFWLCEDVGGLRTVTIHTGSCRVCMEGLGEAAAPKGRASVAGSALPGVLQGPCLKITTPDGREGIVRAHVPGGMQHRGHRHTSLRVALPA